MEKTITRRWSDFLANTTFDALPPEVVHQTKMLILDSLGCALGAYSLKLGKMVVAVGQDLGGRPEATVAGSPQKLHCANAAYVNGKLSNLHDMDETLYNNRHIGGVPVFPAIAVGERTQAEGQAVILATAVAYDFAARSALCGSAFRRDPEKGIVVSGNASMGFNTLAAAIAAGRILNFDRDQMANLLGVAGYVATGAVESKFVYTPPSNINKYADMGWACLGGVFAAICAQNGYVGDPCMLDGPRGIEALLGAPAFDYETFVADLGRRWYILDAGFKLYPTCRWFHTAIHIVEGFIREYKLEPEDVESVTVSIHPLSLSLPTFMAGDKWAEAPSKASWFSIDSLTYAMACAIYGVPEPEWAKDETLTSEKITDMTKRIVHGAHPKAAKMTETWSGHPGRAFSEPPTSVELVSKKGTFSAESTDIPGDSWNPNARLTDNQIIAKFRTNAGYALSDQKVDSIVSRIEDLDKLRDITELTRWLIP